MEELFKTESLFKEIYSRRKTIGAVAAIAAILSFAGSYLIEIRYKSTVVMIPTTTVSISHTLFKEWDDVLKFGEEKEAEQMLQILNSEEIREELAKKYNLYKHYDINANGPYKRLHYKQEFEDRIWFSRTPSNAVEIDVMDRSADTAAAIANEIAALVDSTKNRLQRSRAVKALEIVEYEYIKKKKLVTQLEDSLRFYTNTGVFDYEKQSEVLYKQYAKTLAGNGGQGSKALEEKLKVVGKYGRDYVALRDFTDYERQQLFALKTKFDQAKVDVERSLPSKYMINPGIPAEKKAYPLRWLIVVVSTLSASILAIIISLLLSQYKEKTK